MLHPKCNLEEQISSRTSLSLSFVWISLDPTTYFLESEKKIVCVNSVGKKLSHSGARFGVVKGCCVACVRVSHGGTGHGSCFDSENCVEKNHTHKKSVDSDAVNWPGCVCCLPLLFK